ncbi:MAG: hypothetical protein AAGF23_26320, partial [Acidobacteriota bacterium]
RTAIDFALDVTNYFSPEGEPSTTRQRILARFHTIHSQASEKNPDSKPLFVTHSQGTVLTGEFLSQLKPDGPVDWVTMGSPISHIYGHYFPDAYEQPSPPGEVTWFNLYRNSDFVGRQIDGIDGIRVQESIGDGGHTRYFSDPETLGRLETLKLLPQRRHQTLDSAVAESPTAPPED